MNAPRPPTELPAADAAVRALIGPALLALAAFLFVTRDVSDLPDTEPAEIPWSLVSTEPLRDPPPGLPTIAAGGYRLTCMECHRLFPPGEGEPRRLMQHRHVELEHGLNNRCFNCHHPVDRNRLTLGGGEAIPFTAAARLCAECHGTAYRDWQRGVHGRANGYWDPARGPRRWLICTECHDPHTPAFDPMVPLPAPRTPRMGEPHRAGHAVHEQRHNPLRQWITAGDGPQEAAD